MVRVLNPAGAGRKVLPTAVFFHGGGFFAGNLDTEDSAGRIMSSRTGIRVVTIDYCNGAITPLEDQLSDCMKGWEWVYDNAEEYGFDRKQLVIWGGSAGSSLGVGLAYRLIHSGRGSQIAGLAIMCSMLLHPATEPKEYKHLRTSHQENAGRLPFVSSEDVHRIWNFRKMGVDNIDITFWPVAHGAEALKGFPPTYILSADNDSLRDDSMVMEAALKDAGVRVKLDNVIGLGHYFWMFDVPKATEKFWQTMSGGLMWTLGQ